MFDQYVARRYRMDTRPDPEAYLIKDKTVKEKILGLNIKRLLNI